ncbi:MAG: hypothetical protein IRZ16_02785 [Myxococcaceae bacterium]|nr:hypothetical protein [Myxococcaceae bacterium]
MLRKELLFFVVSAGLLTAWATSCTGDSEIPGESMGLFRFHASPLSFDGGVARACDRISELPKDQGFDFEGVFSQSRESSEKAYFTINGLSRDASLTGQVLTSTVEAGRRFEVDDCVPEFTAEETLEVALISESQARHYAALDGGPGTGCPPDIETLLGSGAFLVDPDAGIVAPSFTPEGFDAIHACGLLIDILRPNGECPAFETAPDGGTTPLDACTATYFVDGVRRQ